MTVTGRIHPIHSPRRLSSWGGPAGLCLLLALASLTSAAAAREVKLGPGGPSCQEDHHEAAADRAASPVASPRAGDGKVQPSLHSDAIRGGRLQSPRWHSFLPGMFR